LLIGAGLDGDPFHEHLVVSKGARWYIGTLDQAAPRITSRESVDG